MSDKNDFQEFSEDAAVKFIRERLSEDVASRLSDDDILDIVDAAYDYYDDNGLLNLSDFDSDVDERKMASAIIESTGCGLTESEVLEIIGLENLYEDSLNDF